MENEKLREKGLSIHDERIILVMGCLVPGESKKLSQSDEANWESICKQVDDIAITTIKKNGKDYLKIVYDYGSQEEQYFFQE